MKISELVNPVLTAAPDAKPVQQSASFQGLAVAMLASVLPSVAAALGVDPAWLSHGVDVLIQAGGFLYAAWGILRRADIRLPWVKSQ